MKKQRTFSGNTPDNYAIEWLLNLAKVFTIKSAKIKSWKSKKDWRHYARVEVDFE